MRCCRLVMALLAIVLCVRSASAQTAWPGEDWETATPASQGMEQRDEQMAQRTEGSVRRARPVGQQHLRGSQPRPDRHPPIRQSDLAPPAKDYRIADCFQLVCDAVKKP